MAAMDSNYIVADDAVLELEPEQGTTQVESLLTVEPNSDHVEEVNNGEKPRKSISSFLKRFRKEKTGGWNSATYLLVNQGLATLAFFGIGVNLVLFLTRVLGQSNASAANNVSKWTGTVYLCSLLGAFFSDSYWGRYLTCAIFQLIFITGLLIMSLASTLLLIKPAGCGDGTEKCTRPTALGTVIFYLAIYMVALGYGGHQPTVATLGADQFDDSNPKGLASKAAFFSCFYFALNLGSLFSNTILVFFEDNGNWTMGFWASTGSAVLALLLFLFGSRGYTYVKPFGNPITRIAQVFVAAFHKCYVKLPEGDQQLYEVHCSHSSSIRGARKILHTDNFKSLDKAAIVTQNDRFGPPNPWRLCTVTQVEEAKCVLRMLPIWMCTIMYSVIFTQMASLFVEQGEVMDTHIGGRSFRIPAASMSAFDICSVLVCTILYRFVVIPFTSAITKTPKGITQLQRMGIGLIIGMLAMVAAGITEIHRLRRVSPGEEMSRLSILWQIPQYVLVGASEVFMYVGQLEFFNGEAPDGVKSFGSSLCMASMSVGNYFSSMLINVVMAITSRREMPGWIPEDLNTGHMDRFYFLIAILAAVDFVIFVLCAKWYRCIKLEENIEGPCLKDGQFEEQQHDLDHQV